MRLNARREQIASIRDTRQGALTALGIVEAQLALPWLSRGLPVALQWTDRGKLKARHHTRLFLVPCRCRTAWTGGIPSGL